MLELIWHLSYMSVLVFVLGYFLHYHAFKHGLADDNDKVKTDALKKGPDGEEKDYKTGNGFLDKWLDFGGGYYGIIAFIHLIFIEFNEVKEFVLGWTGLDEFLQELSFNTLVNIIIEQIMNFVYAISWPAQYFNKFNLMQIAIFIALTYVFYTLSRKLARSRLTVSG